jgi:hypothetical protein
MALKRTTGWMILVFAALLISGCGTDTTNNPLKPPSVYKDPQISVTHAPTEIALDPATIEASASATAEPLVIEPPAGPTEDEQQALMDEIERLLTKIEDKLDRTDLNP